MAEIIYYADSAVQVSSEWVKIGGKLYPTSDIKSVKLCTAQCEPVRELPYYLMIAGSITTFAMLNIEYVFPGVDGNALPDLLLLGVLLGLIGLALLFIQMLLKSDYLYIVKLKGTFGETNPFASDDRRYVNKIITAIDLAIRDRGASTHRANPIAADA